MVVLHLWHLAKPFGHWLLVNRRQRLGDDLGLKANFLSLIGHLNVHNLLTFNMEATMVIDIRRHMDNPLFCDWHRTFHELLNCLLNDALLRNELG